MIVYVLFLLSAGVLASFALFWIIGTDILCKRHQEEWNRLKFCLVAHNASQAEINAAYYSYIDNLTVNRHPILGACYPHK